MIAYFCLGKLPNCYNIPQIAAYIIISYRFQVCQAIFWEFLTFFLALSLLMALALGADDHNSAVSLDYFALVAHRFYRRSDFHCIFSLLIKLFYVVCFLRLATPRDPAFRQIVRAHFQFYRIALDDPDIVHSKLTGNIRRDSVTVGKLYLEGRVRQRFDNLSFRFDYVVFGHRNFLRIFYRRGATRRPHFFIVLAYSVSISTPSSRTTNVFS